MLAPDSASPSLFCSQCQLESEEASKQSTECNVHLRALHQVLNDELDRITKNFSVDVKLTLVVRMPNTPDGGLLLTDDSVDEAIATIQRLRHTCKHGG